MYRQAEIVGGRCHKKSRIGPHEETRSALEIERTLSSDEQVAEERKDSDVSVESTGTESLASEEKSQCIGHRK